MKTLEEKHFEQYLENLICTIECFKNSLLRRVPFIFLLVFSEVDLILKSVLIWK